jgi:hypothetical protein
LLPQAGFVYSPCSFSLAILSWIKHSLTNFKSWRRLFETRERLSTAPRSIWSPIWGRFGYIGLHCFIVFVLLYLASFSSSFYPFLSWFLVHFSKGVNIAIFYQDSSGETLK